MAPLALSRALPLLVLAGVSGDWTLVMKRLLWNPVRVLVWVPLSAPFLYWGGEVLSGFRSPYGRLDELVNLAIGSFCLGVGLYFLFRGALLQFVFVGERFLWSPRLRRLDFDRITGITYVQLPSSLLEDRRGIAIEVSDARFSNDWIVLSELIDGELIQSRHADEFFEYLVQVHGVPVKRAPERVFRGWVP